MNVLGECPLKGKEVSIVSGPFEGQTIVVEDWAREVMSEGTEWPFDVGNPAVLLFWCRRGELVYKVTEDIRERIRVSLSGIYGHVGWSGCIVLPEELGIEVES